MNDTTLPSAALGETWSWLFAEHYEIHRLLAHGGQGNIYAARDRRAGRVVALKLIDSDDADCGGAHQRLMLEAGIGHRLAGEHVVTVFDAGRDPATGLSFLTMELLDGLDLQRYVEQNGPIAPETTVEYLRQIAEGLDQAHAFRDSKKRLTPIVHRDLKPANLFLLHRRDGSPQIKILDFGIAAVLEDPAPICSNLRGSPLYMAPEQVSGSRLSPATDIWAIGLLAFFLLTGRAYWSEGQRRCSSLDMLFREVTHGATVLPSRRMEQLSVQLKLPKAFDSWFLRCVHRDPGQRFRTAGTAVLALAKALNVPLRLPNTAGVFSALRKRWHPNPIAILSGRMASWWERLLFLLGAVGGFCTVLLVLLPSVDRATRTILRRELQGTGTCIVKPSDTPSSAAPDGTRPMSTVTSCHIRPKASATTPSHALAPHNSA